MKILSAQQIRAADQYTIKNEPIASIDLMERASVAFTEWFVSNYKSDKHVFIFCGTGNNGGDGLAIARLLFQAEYQVRVCVVSLGAKDSPDFLANRERLTNRTSVDIMSIEEGNELPRIMKDEIVIDAILGSGLSRPAEGFVETVLKHINEKCEEIVSVDVPSGLFTNEPTSGTSILADKTCSFELPKLAFLLPENFYRVGDWTIVPIGLDKKFIEQEKCPLFYSTFNTVKAIYKPRKKGGHKGSYGHSIIIAGSKGKMGAAVLAVHGTLRGGSGLITAHIPKSALNIMQISIPEAMVSLDPSKHVFSKAPDISKFNAIGLGCGIGTSKKTTRAVSKLLAELDDPIVLDADALNIIAKNPKLFEDIPEESILTPHPKEFERLFGSTSNHFERLKLLCLKAQRHQVYIILKGANSAIGCPDGKVYFNSTGNQGMATGGSGDVLTGILTALLAQKYTPFQAAILGVWVHGKSGDILTDKIGHESITATEIANHLGEAFKMFLSSR